MAAAFEIGRGRYCESFPKTERNVADECLAATVGRSPHLAKTSHVRVPIIARGLDLMQLQKPRRGRVESCDETVIRPHVLPAHRPELGLSTGLESAWGCHVDGAAFDRVRGAAGESSDFSVGLADRCPVTLVDRKLYRSAMSSKRMTDAVSGDAR